MTTLGGVNGTVCNAEQYRQSLPSQDNPIPLISCLTHGQSNGLTLAIETSFLSLLSVIAIYTWIGRNFRWYSRNFEDSDWMLFQGPVDIFLFSLLGFDILQAMGGILNIRWAHTGIVSAGPYCTAQGIIEQFGELGVAVITLILAIYTFMVTTSPWTWRPRLESRGPALGLVVLTFIFSALWVGIGAGIHHQYETPTPFWCWISPHFPGERLAGEYIWLWLALFASLLYIPSFFAAGGRLSLDRNNWYMLRFYGVEDEHKRVVLGLVFYPVAYAILVLPLSVARWSLFTHKNVPSAATFFAISVFYLSGAVNALLILIAKPHLLLLTRHRVDDQPERQTVTQSRENRGVVDGQDAMELPQIIGNATITEHSPEPTAMELVDGGSSNSSQATPSRAEHRVSI